MTTPTKAIQFDLRAYIADNNLRRSVASFSINYGSTAEALALNTFVVALAATVVITSPMNPSTVTMLRTSQPLTAVVTFRNSSTLTFQIKKLLVLDSDVMSISVTNSGSNPSAATVTVLQG